MIIEGSKICSRCSGSGKVPVHDCTKVGSGHLNIDYWEQCNECGGTGKIVSIDDFINKL